MGQTNVRRVRAINALMNITVRMQAASAVREIDFLRARIKQLEAQIARANLASSSMIGAGAFNSLSRWGSQMQWAGRQLQSNFTMPILAAGAIATKFYMDNESAMIRLQKVYGDAATGPQQYAKDLGGLNTAFDQLSVRFATNRAQVANIAADWAAAGAEGAALARGVEATLTTMALGELEAGAATQALIAIQAQYGADTKELIRIIEVLNATENTTGVTFAGLVEGMSRSASAARSAGVDVEHLAAMIASMSPAAGSAAQAGNALKTIFSRMLGPTGEARDVLGAMNINIDDVGWTSLNSAERLEVLADAYMKLDGAGEGMISSQAGIVSAVVASRWQINRFDTLMRDLSYHLDDNAATNGYYTKTLELLSDQAAVSALAQRELNTILESQPYALKRAGIVIQNSLMKIIGLVIPQILWMADAVASLFRRFTELHPGIQKAVMGFLLFLAILGPPLILLGSLAVAIGRIGMMFAFLSMASGKFGKSIKGFLLAPLAAMGAALGGLAGKLKAGLGRGLLTLFPSLTPAVAGTAAAAGATVGRVYAGGIAAGTTATAGIASKAALSIAAAEAASLKVSGTANASRIGMMRGFLAKAQLNAALYTQILMRPLNIATAAAAGQWARMNAVTTAGVAGMNARVATGMTMLPIQVNNGMNRANFAVHRSMFIVMPAAFKSGWDRINMAVAAAHMSLNRATERTMMTNLAVLNGYVNAAIATAGRGAAGIAAAATAGGAAIGAGAAAGGVAAGGFIATFMAGLRGLGPKIAGAMRAVGPKMLQGIKAILPFLKTWGLRLVAVLTGPWGIAIAAVLTLITMFRDQIGQLFGNIGRMAQDATSPFGQAWAGVVNIFNKGVEVAKKGIQSLPAGIRGALQAVVNMVGQAAMAVYNFFSYMNPFQRHSPSLVENVTNGMAVINEQFGLASRNIGGHMMNAYESMKRFGQATAGFMGQLNAMKQASDRASIVENAGSGAGGAYDDLLATLVPLQAELLTVGAALERQRASTNAAEGALQRAQDTADAAQRSLDALSKTANDLSTQLDAAQSSLDTFASMPIAGMKEMNDQIFENEMAQKRLRLEMMKMNGGSVDDLRSQLATLEGEIEKLRGTANDLRAKGAGSEILGLYYDQIAALEGQRDAIDAQAGPINDMQKQLEELEKASQILDLEKSINFDPLIKQVDELANSYQEMPFDQIVAGVKAQKQQVTELKGQYDLANAAVERQQVALDAANAEVERAQVAYDAQAASLSALQSVYDSVETQIRDIEQAIQDVVSGAEEMKSALEEAARAAKGAGGSGGGGGGGSLSPALENFNGAAGGGFADPGDAFTIGQEGGDIDQWLDDFMKDTGEIFKTVDMFGPIKDKWASFQGWWGSNVTPIFTNLGQGIVEVFSGIDWIAPIRNAFSWFNTDATIGGAIADWWSFVSEPLMNAWENIKKAWNDSISGIMPELGGLGSSFGDLWKALQEAWTAMQPIFDFLGKALLVIVGIVGGVLGSAFIILANIIERVVMPIVHGLIGIVGGVIQALTGVINFLVGVFTGDWEKAWLGIKQIVGGVWDAIYALFEMAIGTVVGLVMGLVQGVIDAWNWLYDVLVGHSIVPDLINAIIAWFQSLPGKVMAFVTGLVTDAIAWFGRMGSEAGAKVQAGIDAIVSFFAGLPGRAGAALGTLAGVLLEKAQTGVDNMRHGAEAAWGAVNSWFGGIPGRVASAVGDMGSTLYNAGKNILAGFLRGLKDKFEEVKDMVAGIGPWIANNKGPKAYDLGLLVPAGQWIMTGLGNGFKAGIPGLQDTLGQVTGSILNAVGAIPNAAVKSLLSSSPTTGSGGTPTTGTSATMYRGGGETTVYNFNGNLEFPNVTNGSDAADFMRNLNDLAGAK